MSRLALLRHQLKKYNTDLQRTYNWSYRSTKLLIGHADLYLTDIDHPAFQYENMGEYRGFISSRKKPTEINMTFLETDRHLISSLLYFWDSLKYNKDTGIHYPKAVYEDQGILMYTGGGDSQQTPRRRYYTLTGVYPINRSPISLSYGTNDVMRIQATFNVDTIEPQEAANIIAEISNKIKNKREQD